ncbi:MAG: hypothetical protein IJ385_00930 [Ruminiclostridium sp.]|nr:hypothetical protein [Ruminiclostridium sp.]
MTTPKSVRLASIISLAVIALFALTTLLINIYQTPIVTLYAGTTEIAAGSSYIFPAETIAYIAGALLIATADYLMIKEKAVLAPLVLSGLAAICTMPAAAALRTIQSILVSRLQGFDFLARLSTLQLFTTYPFYILNAAIICTVAASAAYAYAKKKGYANEQ